MGSVTTETAKATVAERTKEMGVKWRKLTLPTAERIHCGRESTSEEPQGGSWKLEEDRIGLIALDKSTSLICLDPNSRKNLITPTMKPNSRPKKAPKSFG